KEISIYNFMIISDKTTFKLLAFLLLFLIVGDSLVIFDFFEPTGFGSNPEIASERCIVEVQMHTPSSDSKQNVTPSDSCVLCACCVSGLSICLSFVTDSIEQPLFTILAPESLLLTSISENYVFHPPKHLS
ncbi:MAG: hypothetical protein O7G31_00085, partial [Calditrichaeota bacterium]|nr:hypothetical protein [Calditrichota bacterium]